MPWTSLDVMLQTLLAAMAVGSKTLGAYGFPLLGVLATISFYREHGAVVLAGPGHEAEGLASLLTFALWVGIYEWLLVHMPALAEAALSTVIQWGTEASGGAPMPGDLLTRPSAIIDLGVQVAQPLADFTTWFGTVKSAVRLAQNPFDLLSYWCILLAFCGITLHWVGMLLEYHLAIMLSSVLIPWGIWRATASVSEFCLGWVTGCLIRVLTSAAMLGLAIPVFSTPLLAPPTDGIYTLPHSLALLTTSALFAIMSWTIPARAARMAGGASLGFTGSAIVSGAMTTVRFATGGTQAVRGVSQLVQSQQRR